MYNKNNHKICKVDGCDNFVKGLDYCNKHYQEFKKYGEIREKVVKPTSCIVENCNKPIRAKGYCVKHLGHFNKYGRILNKTFKDFNEIILFENHAEIVLLNNRNEEKGRAIIDLEDVNKCENKCWGLSTTGYTRAKINDKIVYLHRFILDISDSSVIDHINRNKLDNRKCNLRVATMQQNARNRNILKANKSGVIGVHWFKRDGKWCVNIKNDNKTYNLGYYENIEEATIIRLKAEKKYYGEFAPQRHLFEKYNI